MFTITGLDHVALIVRNPEDSARWYEQVLGLRRVHHDVWGPVPLMLVAPGDGQTGLALFPSKD